MTFDTHPLRVPLTLPCAMSAPEVVCDNCSSAATVRLTPKDASDLDCDCGEPLLENGGVITLCKVKCPNFAFQVLDLNAAKTAAKVEMDDQVECIACGKGYHCVRCWNRQCFWC